MYVVLVSNWTLLASALLYVGLENMEPVFDLSVLGYCITMAVQLSGRRPISSLGLKGFYADKNTKSLGSILSLSILDSIFTNKGLMPSVDETWRLQIVSAFYEERNSIKRKWTVSLNSTLFCHFPFCHIFRIHDSVLVLVKNTLIRSFTCILSVWVTDLISSPGTVPEHLCAAAWLPHN